MRLLLAEDDELLGTAMRDALIRDGYATDWVQCGHDFQGALACHQYDCAVLDLGLPDVGGDVLLREVRGTRARLPVIIVTGRRGVDHLVTLMDGGADDYLVKPFDLHELSARIRSVVRRSSQDGNAGDALSYGPLTLYPQRYCAMWDGEQISLTRREYWVLEILVRRRNQVLSRAQLEEALYGWGEEVDSNAIEVYIHFLRRKFHQGLIHTIRGVGYQLAPLHRHA